MKTSLVNLEKTGWDSDRSLWPGRTRPSNSCSHLFLSPIPLSISPFLPFYLHTHMHVCARTHTHTCAHVSKLQREVCYVSESGLGQKRKSISPIPSPESLTLKGEGERGWIIGESFLPPF